MSGRKRRDDTDPQVLLIRTMWQAAEKGKCDKEFMSGAPLDAAGTSEPSAEPTAEPLSAPQRCFAWMWT